MRESAESSSEVESEMMRSSGEAAIRREELEIPPMRRIEDADDDGEVSASVLGGACGAVI